MYIYTTLYTTSHSLNWMSDVILAYWIHNMVQRSFNMSFVLWYRLKQAVRYLRVSMHTHTHTLTTCILIFSTSIHFWVRPLRVRVWILSKVNFYVVSLIIHSAVGSAQRAPHYNQRRALSNALFVDKEPTIALTYTNNNKKKKLHKIKLPETHREGW